MKTSKNKSMQMRKKALLLLNVLQIGNINSCNNLYTDQ